VEAASDAELVQRVLGGHTPTYEVLVRRYQESLYRHAVGMVGDSDAAADLVQDSLVKAYTRLGTCDPDRFAAWLFRILRNRCKDWLKSRRRRDVPLGVPVRGVQRRHVRFIAATAWQQRGDERKAFAELEQALVLDPLNLDLQKRYWSLKRKLSAA